MPGIKDLNHTNFEQIQAFTALGEMYRPWVGDTVGLGGVGERLEGVRGGGEGTEGAGADLEIAMIVIAAK